MYVNESERDERERDERCTIFGAAGARSVRTHEWVAHNSESGEGIEEGL